MVNVKSKSVSVGMRFGKLTVMEEIRVHCSNSKWVCQCDCGKTVTVLNPNLVSGKTKSCGCSKYKDKSHTKIYSNYYRNLRTKGCSWETFEEFEKWALGHGYEEGKSMIKRINVGEPFSPENCFICKKP